MFELDKTAAIGFHEAQAKCSKVKAEDLLVDFDPHSDGLPILSTGLNKAGERVIQSSIDEDDEGIVYWFFQVFPADEIYAQWRSGNLSWRAVLETASQIYIAKAVSEDGSPRHACVVDAFIVNWDDVPEEYRPSEASFIPK